MALTFVLLTFEFGAKFDGKTSKKPVFFFLLFLQKGRMRPTVRIWTAPLEPPRQTVLCIINLQGKKLQGIKGTPSRILVCKTEF